MEFLGRNFQEGFFNETVNLKDINHVFVILPFPHQQLIEAQV